MKFTYYLSPAEDDKGFRFLHNATCQFYLQNKETMLPLGRHEQFRVVLDIARGIARKVTPCPKCVLRRRLYNLAPSKRVPVPVRHSDKK